MRMSGSDVPDSARNLSSGDITVARGGPQDGSLRSVQTNFSDFDSRTSTIPSEKLVAEMVPSGDKASLVVRRCGDSATFKSHRRIVLSRDADARRGPTGEN